MTCVAFGFPESGRKTSKNGLDEAVPEATSAEMGILSGEEATALLREAECDRGTISVLRCSHWALPRVPGRPTRHDSLLAKSPMT